MIENQRLLIWATFGMLLYMTYQAWVTDNAPPPPVAPETAQGDSLPVIGDDLPALPQGQTDQPTQGPGNQIPSLERAADAAAPTQDTANSAPGIRGVTDVLELDISTERSLKVYFILQ